MNNTCDYIDLAVSGVRSLRPYQPGKPEDELAREYGVSDIVKLASNENPLGPPPAAVTAVRDSLQGLARYPDGGGYQLRQVLAERLAVSADTITLGNGSNDVLELLARAYLNEQTEAVFSEHAFAVYYLATQAVGAIQRIAAAQGDNQTMAYGHDLAAFSALLSDRTRIVLIANPNNPTGTWLSSDALQAFIAAVPADVLVVVDEAYFEYVDAPDYASALPLLARYDNLVVTRTFSKAYGLAGLRVGYCVSNPQVADVLNRVRQPFNVNLPALAGAVAALDDTDYLARSLTLNTAGLEQLRQGFDRLGLRYLASQANFLCVDVGRRGDQVFQALLPKGIIVRPVGNYGLPNFIRVSVGLEHENTRFLTALEQVLQ